MREVARAKRVTEGEKNLLNRSVLQHRPVFLYTKALLFLQLRIKQGLPLSAVSAHHEVPKEYVPILFTIVRFSVNTHFIGL